MSRKIHRFCTGLAVSAFVTAPALAQDGGYDWSGPYVGVHVGYGAGNFDGVFDADDFGGVPNPAPVVTGGGMGNGGTVSGGTNDGGVAVAFAGEAGPEDSRAFASDLDLDGIAGGVYAGYNFQFDDWVVGIEADATYAGWDDDAIDVDGNLNDGIEGEVEWLGSLRLRGGRAFDRVMVYGTAGVAVAKAEYTAIDGLVDTGPNRSGSTDIGDIGLAVGAGVEWAATDRLRLRAEGMYYHFGDKQDASDLTPDSDGPDFVEFEDAYLLRIGVSYAF